MKKSVLVIFCLFSFYNLNKVHAAFSTSEIPVTNNQPWKNLKAVEFVKLSAKNFSKLCGKKLTLKEKISFQVLKMEMKKEIKKNPNLTVSEFLSHKKKLGTGWIILICVVGTVLLLGLIFIISGGLDFDLRG